MIPPERIIENTNLTNDKYNYETLCYINEHHLVITNQFGFVYCKRCKDGVFYDDILSHDVDSIPKYLMGHYLAKECPKTDYPWDC